MKRKRFGLLRSSANINHPPQPSQPQQQLQHTNLHLQQAQKTSNLDAEMTTVYFSTDSASTPAEAASAESGMATSPDITSAKRESSEVLSSRSKSNLSSHQQQQSASSSTLDTRHGTDSTFSTWTSSTHKSSQRTSCFRWSDSSQTMATATESRTSQQLMNIMHIIDQPTNLSPRSSSADQEVVNHSSVTLLSHSGSQNPVIVLEELQKIKEEAESDTNSLCSSSIMPRISPNVFNESKVVSSNPRIQQKIEQLRSMLWLQFSASSSSSQSEAGRNSSGNAGDFSNNFESLFLVKPPSKAGSQDNVIPIEAELHKTIGMQEGGPITLSTSTIITAAPIIASTTATAIQLSPRVKKASAGDLTVSITREQQMSDYQLLKKSVVEKSMKLLGSESFPVKQPLVSAMRNAPLPGEAPMRLVKSNKLELSTDQASVSSRGGGGGVTNVHAAVLGYSRQLTPPEAQKDSIKITTEQNMIFQIFPAANKKITSSLSQFNVQEVVFEGSLEKKVKGLLNRWKKVKVSCYLDRVTIHRESAIKQVKCISFKDFHVELTKDVLRRSFTLRVKGQKKKYRFKCQTQAELNVWVEIMADIILFNASSSKSSVKPEFYALYGEHHVRNPKDVVDQLNSGDLLLYSLKDGQNGKSREGIALVIRTKYIVEVCFYSAQEEGILTYPFKTFLQLFALQTLKVRHLTSKESNDIFEKREQWTGSFISSINNCRDQQRRSYALIWNLLVQSGILVPHAKENVLAEKSIVETSRINAFLSQSLAFEDITHCILSNHIQAESSRASLVENRRSQPDYIEFGQAFQKDDGW